MATKKLIADLDFSQNEAQNMVVQNLAADPANKKAGQLWFSTADNFLYYFDGTQDRVVGKPYVLPAATTTTLGGIIVGSHLGVAGDGTLSVDEASTTQKGVIEIATDAEVSTGTSETLAVNPKQLATKVDKLSSGPTAGTYTKVTVNSEGQVTAGGSLVAGDIPDISATYVPQTSVGVANGVASLDNDGKVPSSQLPSYVDDVVDAYIVSGATALSAGWLSATDGGTALTPETGKIYVVLTDGTYKDKTYRWSGTTYVEISSAPGQATESTPGIAAIATQAECTTGTNDTKIVTPLKLATYTSGMAKKSTATNPALTASGGVCTWSLSSIPTDAIISVYEVSSGAEVFCEIVHGTGSATIKMNSSSNIAAGTYKAIVIG